MGKRYRTRAQRENDLDEIASYYLQGRTQRWIGEKIGLSQSMIAKELKVLIQRWQESALISFNEIKAVQLARIDHLEATYWEAWYASKRDKLKTVSEEIPGGTSQGEVRSKTQETKEQRDGNPSFLHGVERCIQERSKILGIHAPTKIAPTTPDGENPYEAGAVFLIPDDGSPMLGHPRLCS